MNLSIVDQIVRENNGKKNWELKRHPAKLSLQQGYEHLAELNKPVDYQTIYVCEDEVEKALNDLEKKEDEEILIERCTLRTLDELIDLRDPVVQLAAKFLILIEHIELL